MNISHDQEYYTNSCCNKARYDKHYERIQFTKAQKDILENAFLENNYISHCQTDYLAKKLQVSGRQIKTWFQNKRATVRRHIKKKAGYVPQLKLHASFYQRQLNSTANIFKNNANRSCKSKVDAETKVNVHHECRKNSNTDASTKGTNVITNADGSHSYFPLNYNPTSPSFVQTLSYNGPAVKTERINYEFNVKCPYNSDSQAVVSKSFVSTCAEIANYCPSDDSTTAIIDRTRYFNDYWAKNELNIPTSETGYCYSQGNATQNRQSNNYVTNYRILNKRASNGCQATRKCSIQSSCPMNSDCDSYFTAVSLSSDMQQSYQSGQIMEKPRQFSESSISNSSSGRWNSTDSLTSLILDISANSLIASY